MIKTVFFNIRNLYKSEKIILSIIVLCTVFSSLIMNFSYGLYQNYTQQKQEAEFDLKELKPEINRLFTKRELKAFTDSLSADTLNHSTLIYAEAELDEFPVGNGENTNMPIRFTVINGCYSSCAVTKKSFENSGMLSGRYFSEIEEANGDNVALIANSNEAGISEFTNKLFVDEQKISLFGKEYQVIGEYNMGSTTPIVPFLSLPESLELTEFYMMFDKNITRSMYNEIIEHAQMYIPDALGFEDINFPDTETLYIYNNTIIISVILALLSLLNFAAIYSFIISSRKKEISIFRMVGLTKLKISFAIIMECFILSFPMFLFGTILFDWLLKNILSNHFIYMNNFFNINVYLFMGSVYSIMMFLIIKLTTKFQIKNRIIQNLKGE